VEPGGSLRLALGGRLILPRPTTRIELPNPSAGPSASESAGVVEIRFRAKAFFHPLAVQACSKFPQEPDHGGVAAEAEDGPPKWRVAMGVT